MARMLRHNSPSPYDPQFPPAVAPVQRRARWRFRWGRFVGLPLLCVLAFLAIRAIGGFLAEMDPGGLLPQWNPDLDWRSLSEIERLGLLGTGLISLVALLRVFRDRFWR